MLKMSAGMNPAMISAVYSAVPDALTSSKKNRIMPVSVRNVSVPSTSGSQNSGGQLLFQMTSPNGFVKPGSMYLKCRIALSNAIANGAAASFVAFGNATRSASSVIDRFTITCGSVIESIQNYGSAYVPTLLLHAGTQSYLQGDDGIQEGGKRLVAASYSAGVNTSVLLNQWVDLAANAVLGDVQAANVYIDVAIPIFSNLFQNDRAYPLALQSSPTLVQLDLAQMGKAFSIGPTALYSEYTVSNAQLVYDLVIPSAEFLQATKAEMASGMLYSMPFVSSLGTQFAKNSQSITYNWATGLSSLLGITYSCLVAPATLTSEKYLISDNTVGIIANNNMRLMIDGVQQNSVILDTPSVRYSELAKVFGLLGDVSRTSGTCGDLTANTASSFITSPVNYETRSFVGGLNTMKVSDGALAFSGTAANTVQFMLDTGNNTASLVVLNAFHQRILVIDSSGNCSVVL
jgi:hypothetical protein